MYNILHIYNHTYIWENLGFFACFKSFVNCKSHDSILFFLNVFLIFIYFKFYSFIYVCEVWAACMSVHYVHAVPLKARRGPWLRTGVTNACKLPCGYWESNLGPLKNSRFSEALSLLSSSCFTVFRCVPVYMWF